MSVRIEEVSYADAAYTPGEISDAYLAANKLTRAQWEAMVAKEMAKQRREPKQQELFA